MRRPRGIDALFVLICTMGFLLVSSTFVPESCNAQGDLTAYFSQGQALYDQQDPVRSQQNAVRDLLGQAVMQAVGTYLSPSQMGSYYAALREKIIRQPERYVDTYQVFFESAENGLYRVVGQVTISMDLLRKDLTEFGISKSADAYPAKQAGQGSGEVSSSSAAKPVASAGSSGQTETPPAVVRGIAPTVREILWAVTEKWDQEWYLPEDVRDPRGLFAVSVLQELQAYHYSLHLPEPGSLRMDNSGNVSVTQALAQAKTLGIRNAIVGSVMYKRERNQSARLQADLQVLEVSSGKLLGKIHKERDMEEGSNQEGALDLAEEVMHELERMLSLAPGGSTPVQKSSEPAAAAAEGEWIVKIKMSDQYSYWKDMEQMLREQAKGLQVRGVEMGLDENVIRLGGIDGRLIMNLNGKALPGGTVIRIDNFSEDNHSLSVSFIPSGAPQPGAKQ